VVKESDVDRPGDFSEKVAEFDEIDPNLRAIISRLNESSAVIDDTEVADSIAPNVAEIASDEVRASHDRQKAPHQYSDKTHVAALPEEIKEFNHSFQSALFPGRNAPDKTHGRAQAHPSNTATAEGQTSRASSPGILVLAVLIILGASGAIWHGSRVDREIGNLSQTVDRLVRQVSESRSYTQQMEHEIRKSHQLQLATRQSTQLIEQAVKDLELAMATGIEALSGQMKDLQDSGAGIRTSVSPVTALKPSPTWGVNMASFTTRNTAVRELEKIRGMGTKVVIRDAFVKGKHWYRLRFEGFSDKKAAGDFIKQNRSRPEFADAWISKGY